MNQCAWPHRWGWALVWVLMAGLADAKLSLSVRFPDVELENVQPGSVVNLRQKAGVPYVVINGSDHAVDVEVTAETPGLRDGTLRSGYEATPHPEWVRVVPNRFRLGPGDIASAEIVLSVPEDPKWVGRHLQVNLRASTNGPETIAVAVRNYMMFTVGAAGPESAKKEKRRRVLGQLDLDLTPPTVRLENVPVGKRVDLKAFGQVVWKLTNRGHESAKVKLASVRPSNTQKEEGWLLPDPSWLSLAPTVLRVKPDRIKSTRGTLLIPDRPENRGKKFLFLIETELDGMDFPLGFTSRVFVTTEP